MDFEEAVVVATFPDLMTADLAAAFLNSRGIGVMVARDDAGGYYPQLNFTRGVALVVERADLERAREALKEDHPLAAMDNDDDDADDDRETSDKN